MENGHYRRIVLLRTIRSEPSLYQSDNIVNLPIRQLPPFWDAVPLGQAAPAACRRSMLCDKDRMVPHRCLLTVISSLSRAQPLFDEIPRMIQNRRKSFLLKIRHLLRPQPKPIAKLRPAQRLE